MSNVETKKLISMDKKYKARDVRDVRVLCVDAGEPNYPVVATVGGLAFQFTAYGKYSVNCDNSRDLIEIPEEKTVWLEIYRMSFWNSDVNAAVIIHNSKEAAEDKISSHKLQCGMQYQFISLKKITYVEGEGIND